MNNASLFLEKYYDVLYERNDLNKVIVTPQYVEENREFMEELVRTFTLYPDYLIDAVTPSGFYFELFFAQRIFLRVCMRFQTVYGVFPRAFSKSFLNFLAMLIRGIMLPGSKGFTCAGSKRQAAGIIEEKTNEIFSLFPFFVNELDISKVDREKKKWGNMGADYVELFLKNASRLDIVTTDSGARGGRRHWGTLEEFVLMDGDKVNESIIPLMNVDRRTVSGQLNDTEPHACQTMITTAGYKNTYAHDRALETLVDMALDPERAFCFGGDFRIPLMHGLLSPDKIKDRLKVASYKIESFLREFMSVWTGGSEDSYFPHLLIGKRRTLLRPEFSGGSSPNFFYVIVVDVGRFDDQTAILVKKVYTNGERFKVNLVNIKILENTHFSDQAIAIKKLIFLFNPDALVVDINGPGAGLADYLLEEQEQEGVFYPAYGFLNKPKYIKTEKKNCLKIIYGIEATRALNSDIYTHLRTMLSLGRLSLLIDERQARRYFNKFKFWKKLKLEKQAVKLIPYTLTTKLHDQLSNLKANVDTDGGIILSKIRSGMKKDLVSALGYGLYYIREKEEKMKKAQNVDSSKAEFYFYN
jgi:hypothetical protein